MRRLGLASALLATLLTLPLAGPALAAPAPAPGPALSGFSAPAPVTAAERATAALRFLVTAQRADGSLDGSIGETADLVIGAADAGFDPATLRGCSGSGVSALDFIARASDGAAVDAGKTAKAILAAVAAGRDPAAFAGRDLVARLDALYHPATGAYGDGSTFGQALAILSLSAAHRPLPAKALDWLAALEDTDGSWNFGKAANATAGDTNSTAIALVALAAAGDHSHEAKALAWLHTQQLADGGFPYQNSTAFGPPASDPDSDSLVMQALVASGQNPAGAAWTKSGATVVTQLASLQAPNGGFTFPGSKAPDALTTSQVPAGLLGKPYAAPVRWTAGRAISGLACPAARATPTAGAATAAPGVAAAATPPPTSTAATSRGTADPSLPAAVALVALLVALGGAALLAGRRRT